MAPLYGSAAPGYAVTMRSVAVREALAGTVWHTGCRNWYVDENGEDPNQWPWTWSGYRRRTATLAPGAYALRTSDRSPTASLG